MQLPGSSALPLCRKPESIELVLSEHIPLSVSELLVWLVTRRACGCSYWWLFNLLA